MQPVDLRSDTVTRPSEAMRAAMARAEVGDDVFGEDPTVRALEERAAGLTDQEAALFVPSGTMGNQLAILSWCQRGDDVLVGEGAHSQTSEGGGGAVLAGVQFTVVGRGGHFTPTELGAAIQAVDPSGHAPPSTLLMIENTHNRGGGNVMAPVTLASLSAVARARGLHVHIDGARIFNAAAACDLPVAAFTHHADSVSFCLSKGLGCPVGSVLCGPRDFIRRAHRYRKMLGGGLRQAGILAAAGLYALDHHVADVPADHARARRLAEALAALPGADLDVATVQTNIVIFKTPGRRPADVCAALADRVRVLPFGPETVRAVLHRDISDADVERALPAFQAVLGA